MVQESSSGRAYSRGGRSRVISGRSKRIIMKTTKIWLSKLSQLFYGWSNHHFLVLRAMQCWKQKNRISFQETRTFWNFFWNLELLQTLKIGEGEARWRTYYKLMSLFQDIFLHLSYSFFYGRIKVGIVSYIMT